MVQHTRDGVHTFPRAAKRWLWGAHAERLTCPYCGREPPETLIWCHRSSDAAFCDSRCSTWIFIAIAPIPPPPGCAEGLTKEAKLPGKQGSRSAVCAAGSVAHAASRGRVPLQPLWLRCSHRAGAPSSTALPRAGLQQRAAQVTPLPSEIRLLGALRRHRISRTILFCSN